MNKTQKRNARRAGLTVAEAKKLIAETKRDERLDRQSYRESSQAERDAHDNL
jgi:hypothetical protein